MLRHAVSTTIFTVILLLLAIPACGQESLKELVKKYGRVEPILLEETGPADLGELVATASLIVDGTIRGVRSYLAERETEIWTDYDLAIIDVYKQSKTARHKGDVVTIRRRGGVMNVDGYDVVARVPDFPFFRRVSATFCS